MAFQDTGYFLGRSVEDRLLPSTESALIFLSDQDERQNEVVKVYEREVARLAAEREANRDIVEELQNQCQVSGQEVRLVSIV